jgi:hypothetical protein
LTCDLKTKKHLWSISKFWFLLQSDSILQKILIHGIHLFNKSKMGFRYGIINILKATNVSTDLSFWSKEINTSDPKEIKNMNWSTSGEDTSSIWNKISNTRLTIQPDEDKLFSQKISRRISKFKDQLDQADSMLLINSIFN